MHTFFRTVITSGQEYKLDAGPCYIEMRTVLVNTIKKSDNTVYPINWT
jgi:hypothetical protein